MERERCPSTLRRFARHHLAWACTMVMTACGVATEANLSAGSATSDPSVMPATPTTPASSVTRDGQRPPSLVVAEVMILPAGGSRCRQWVELSNLTDRPLCLRDWTLAVETDWQRWNGALAACPCVPAGARLVVGDCLAPDRRWAGGVVAHCSWGEWPLPATAGLLTLSRQGEVHDAVAYGPQAPAPPPLGGRALARQADGRWCNVVGPTYDGVNQGSPNAANPGCALCRQADGWRHLRPPPPGCVVLQALQADPAGPDAGREWLVLQASCTIDVDLAHLRLFRVDPAERRLAEWRLVGQGCLPMAAGTVAQHAIGSRRGQTPPKVPFWRGPPLPNRRSTYVLSSDLDEQPVDWVTFPHLPHHAGVPRLAGAAIVPAELGEIAGSSGSTKSAESAESAAAQ